MNEIWQSHLPTPPLEEGFREFSTEVTAFRALYDKFENSQEKRINELLRRGKLVDVGAKNWTKHDVEDIARWKSMYALLPKIEEAQDLDRLLNRAFRLEDEESKIDALCRIPSIGPALASILLTLTYPSEYAPLDSRAWNGLCSLGFDLPTRPFSGVATQFRSCCGT